MTNEQLAAVLDEIADGAGGNLSTDEVIAHARSPNSPLHQYFTWDLHAAAYQAWTQTARVLIRRAREFRVVKTETVVRLAVPRYVPVPVEQAGYKRLAEVRDDDDCKRRLLTRELVAARGYVKRVAAIAADLDRPDLNLDEAVAILDAAVAELTAEEQNAVA